MYQQAFSVSFFSTKIHIHGSSTLPPHTDSYMDNRMTVHKYPTAIILALAVTMASAQILVAKDIPDHITAIRAVGKRAKGHAAAIQAWQALSQLPATSLPEVLAGMDGANDLAVNWLRSAADTITQRHLEAKKTLPIKQLEEFISDTSHHPRARRTAYEIILLVDKGAHDRIIPGLLNDPSLELRRDAVAHAIAQSLAASGTDAAIESFQNALRGARDLDQIEVITKHIRDRGGEVNLRKQFGFLLDWSLVGPFDNSEKRGFDQAYPPEVELDLTHTYKGKDGDVSWRTHTTEDEYGTVDLNVVMGKHKGAICYAHTIFHSADKRPVDLRLGCINGNKVWLNGKLLTSNHVYHASTSIDQYISKGEIKKGRNEILIKIAQNEQTEDWAQRWQFQLRVCDQYGTAIHSSEGP